MYSRINILSRTKIIVLSVALVTSIQSSFSQANNQKGNFFRERLISSVGFDYSLQEENVPATAGINFSPQLFLTTSFSDFSFSVAADIMMNYRFVNDETNYDNKLFFQLPAMARVNVGHLASKDFFSAIGFFAGAGWNLQYAESVTVNGFAWDAGVRFWLLGKSFTLCFTDLPGNEKIFSSGEIIALQINLGKYLNDVRANNKVSNFMKPYNKKK